MRLLRRKRTLQLKRRVDPNLAGALATGAPVSNKERWVEPRIEEGSKAGRLLLLAFWFHFASQMVYWTCEADR